MKIYHNPRCRKSRETLALITEAGVEPEIVEYLNNLPSKAELSELIMLLGMTPHELIRKGEKEYKDHFKGRQLSDDEWIDVMLQHPKLIERPIVRKGDSVVIGRPPENVNSLL